MKLSLVESAFHDVKYRESPANTIQSVITMRNTVEVPANAIQSVVKAANVMEALADGGKPLSLSQIAEMVSMGLPTTYRFLRTLEFLEWVERVPESKQYRISPRVVRFAHSFFDTSDLWSFAHHHLIKARRQYNETFNLTILDETDILYIDRVKTRKILDINLEIGSKLPAFCTSMGRVLLASLPIVKARRLLERSVRTAFTRYTITDTTALMTILDDVRIQGYALNHGEIASELLSVAAPVRNIDGEVVAAVNMAVNADHYNRSAVKVTLIPAVISVAEQISKALGYHQ